MEVTVNFGWCRKGVAPTLECGHPHFSTYKTPPMCTATTPLLSVIGLLFVD